MLPRVVRAVLGTLLLLIGIPLLLTGGLLYVAMQHQHPAGGYSARLHPITTEGHAVVVSDVDALLRREAAFARAGRTTLQLTARTEHGPAFLGLAPAGDAAAYLTGVPFAQVDQVRLARGPLPVATTRVTGAGPPARPPQRQPIWLASGTGTLEWSPEELRGRQLALVVMDPAGAAPLTVDLSVRMDPRWLASTTFGLLVLGGLSVLLAVAALAWPGRHRDIVYVVPPTQLPEIAAHLGVPLGRDPAPHEPEPAARESALAAGDIGSSGTGRSDSDSSDADGRPPAGPPAPGAGTGRTAAGLEWPPAADYTPATPVPALVAAPTSPTAAMPPRASVPAAPAAPAGSPAAAGAPPVPALAAWLGPDAPSLPLGSWSVPLRRPEPAAADG